MYVQIQAVLSLYASGRTTGLVLDSKTPLASSNKKSAAAAGKAQPTDAGWKEVVRKSKKVSVPSNAISRVIGRGGFNINAIRELSGAHIEVVRKSKKVSVPSNAIS